MLMSNSERIAANAVISDAVGMVYVDAANGNVDAEEQDKEEVAPDVVTGTVLVIAKPTIENTSTTVPSVSKQAFLLNQPKTDTSTTNSNSEEINTKAIENLVLISQFSTQKEINNYLILNKRGASFQIWWD